MKKLLFVICTLFATVAIGETTNIDWYVDGSVYTTTTCTIGGDIILPTAPTKRGYTFVGWSEFIPIEYIQSDGTQYIDTGFKPNQNTRVIMEYTVTTYNSVGFVFGGRNAARNAASFGELYSGSGKWRSDYGANGGSIEGPQLSSAFYNHRIKIDKNKNVTYVYDESNNILVNISHTGQTFQTSFNMVFPSMNDAGTVMSFSRMIRIYCFQIYDNGVLVRDMIPVLDGNNVPCMYDKVSETFFYNAGTGNFIAGPVVTE